MNSMSWEIPAHCNNSCLEGLQSNNELKNAYYDFIEKYKKLGHTVRVSILTTESVDESYFLTHYCVHKSAVWQQKYA